MFLLQYEKIKEYFGTPFLRNYIIYYSYTILPDEVK